MSSIFFRSNPNSTVGKFLQQRGYLVEKANIGDELFVRITSPAGRHWLSGRKIVHPMNSHTVHELCNDKAITYAFADKIGLSIPEFCQIKAGEDYGPAFDLLASSRKVIIKPLDGMKSRGVVLNIADDEHLRTALDEGLLASKGYLVQEQLSGEEYRFSYLNGRVVSVIRRERAQVVGDGSSSIKQLVEKENLSRIGLGNEHITYPQWTRELLGDQIDSDEVLEKDETRLFSGIALVSKGASLYEVIETINQSYIDAANLFAETIGAGFVAIDMFIKDHNLPADGSNYWFNECNISPELNMYFAARNADNSHISEEVLDSWDRLLNNDVKNDIIVG